MHTEPFSEDTHTERHTRVHGLEDKWSLLTHRQRCRQAAFPFECSAKPQAAITLVPVCLTAAEIACCVFTLWQKMMTDNGDVMVFFKTNCNGKKDQLQYYKTNSQQYMHFFLTRVNTKTWSSPFFSLSQHKSMCHSEEALWNVLYMLCRAAFPGINWQRF